MTRSFKKNPVISNCCCGKGSAMRFAKRKANRVVRQQHEDIPNGNHYRRIVERWWFPDDGKQRWDNPKAYRK